MAEVSIGPGGYAIGGTPCTSNSFLGDQNSPLSLLRDTLTIQRATALKTMLYPSWAQQLDQHMPMRESTADRVDGVVDYKISIGYDNLLNSTALTDTTPTSSPYTDTRSLQGQCDTRSKALGASVNGNAEGCNPSIDGPIPILGHEAYGRRSYVFRLPIPPICFASFTNKEKFHDALKGQMQAVQNATIAAWAANKYKWVIAHSRYNAAPIQISQSNGGAKLPVDPNLFTGFTFGRVPEHYGSADWIASMLRFSEIDPNQNVFVDLPASIFAKYKEQLASALGINVYEQAANITAAVNGYLRNIIEDTLIFTDRSTGRKITFRVSRTPVYVEVEETGPLRGQWAYQEPWIFRDSETANQVVARSNPALGVSCSCAGKVLAAIISVSADTGRKPFYTEPLPGIPDSGLRALIDSFGGKGSEVNTTLKELYPTSVQTTIFTGLDFQIWMGQPMNQRFRDAGYNCDVVSNLENTWIGGYTKIAGVFVEDSPRELVNFMLRVPTESPCVDIFVPCGTTATIPTAGVIDPVQRPLVKQVLPVPDPVDPVAAAAGTIAPVGRGTASIIADCTSATSRTLRFTRLGGTAGAISINVAGTPSAHVGAVPGTVNFADGQVNSTLVIPINAWNQNPQATENFTLTFSGAALDSGAFTTRVICVKSNPNCVGVCDVDTSACSTCS